MRNVSGDHTALARSALARPPASPCDAMYRRSGPGVQTSGSTDAANRIILLTSMALSLSCRDRRRTAVLITLGGACREANLSGETLRFASRRERTGPQRFGSRSSHERFQLSAHGTLSPFGSPWLGSEEPSDASVGEGASPSARGLYEVIERELAAINDQM